ncbi:FCD domain-containing protein [Capillimicrobium parvum]|nr:FCD domain-containing protein [Capillimicrobium parvum]
MSPSHLPSSSRHSVLAPLDSGGRVAVVERRLADAIDVGVFGEGDQLPSESDLAAQLGVATVTLREALAGLRRTGLVETRRGRHGGTFVRGPADGRLLDRIGALSVDELRDLADHRTAVAATVAELAAERASAPDLERLEEHVERLAAASGPVERRAADERFHVELAATTRSLRLTRAEMDLQAEAGPLVWLVADPERALRDHRAVLAAVRERRPRAARERMAAHVGAEFEALVALHLRRLTPDPAPVLDRVCTALEAVFDEIASVRAVVLELPAAPHRTDLAPIRDRVHAILERSPLVAGAGMVFAPGALRDAPRWLEWWRRAGSGPPVFLNAELDPGRPEFYDYEAAEWFTTPRDTGTRWIAGPFVDHSGTNEHILTLTMPVVRDGRFLGVAGADIAVGSIEPIAGPALAAVGADAVLLNHRGRVIATNTPRWPVGVLWGGDPAGARVERDPRVGWNVVISA